MRYLTLLLVIPAFVHSQSVDFNRIVLPEHVANASFEEKLVQLAWRNHPSNQIKEKNVLIAKQETKIAKWRWLDEIYAAGNLNEFTINNPDPENSFNTFYPRYNFGIRLSLGTFVNTPMNVRASQLRVDNSSLEINEKKMLVREQVLSGLEKVKQYYKFLRLREQIREDMLMIYKDSEKKFSTGEIDIEKYRSSVQSYYAQAEKVTEAETNFNTAKIALEGMLGVSLNEIDGYVQFLQVLDSQIRLD